MISLRFFHKTKDCQARNLFLAATFVAGNLWGDLSNSLMNFSPTSTWVALIALKRRKAKLGKQKARPINQKGRRTPQTQGWRSLAGPRHKLGQRKYKQGKTQIICGRTWKGRAGQEHWLHLWMLAFTKKRFQCLVCVWNHGRAQSSPLLVCLILGTIFESARDPSFIMTRKVFTLLKLGWIGRCYVYFVSDVIFLVTNLDCLPCQTKGKCLGNCQ